MQRYGFLDHIIALLDLPFKLGYYRVLTLYYLLIMLLHFFGFLVLQLLDQFLRVWLL